MGLLNTSVKHVMNDINIKPVVTVVLKVGMQKKDRKRLVQTKQHCAYYSNLCCLT